MLGYLSDFCVSLDKMVLFSKINVCGLEVKHNHIYTYIHTCFSYYYYIIICYDIIFSNVIILSKIVSFPLKKILLYVGSFLQIPREFWLSINI